MVFNDKHPRREEDSGANEKDLERIGMVNWRYRALSCLIHSRLLSRVMGNRQIRVIRTFREARQYFYDVLTRYLVIFGAIMCFVYGSTMMTNLMRG